MLNRTFEILQRGIDEGLHLGAQIYASVSGQPVCDDAIGRARFGVPMRSDSINWWLSACKPITAIAIAQLWEKQKLDLDDRVAAHIPEFARGGKEAITIRHLLTHTGGFRGVSSNTAPGAWSEIIESISAANLEPGWVPGEKAGYHLASSWFILAEIVQRIDGRTIDRYAREQIFLPLGMTDSWLAVPPEQFHAYGDRIVTTYPTDKHPPDPSHTPLSAEAAALVRPGGSGRGPMRDLGRFYEMLMNGGALGDALILSPQTVQSFVTRQRIGMFDHTFKAVVDWGLGFVINSGPDAPYNYGVHASLDTFGHSGSQCSCAFCDPQRKLVVAWVCNGRPGEPKHQARQRAVNDAIYEDLGLVQ
jgi:CubicO group peptidase (beta-lactamase class C family)